MAVCPYFLRAVRGACLGDNWERLAIEPVSCTRLLQVKRLAPVAGSRLLVTRVERLATELGNRLEVGRMTRLVTSCFLGLATVRLGRLVVTLAVRLGVTFNLRFSHSRGGLLRRMAIGSCNNRAFCLTCTHSFRCAKLSSCLLNNCC